MSRIQTIACAGLKMATGMSVNSLYADDPNPEPKLKTSTGHELNGPGTHHGEYAASPSDTGFVRRDTLPMDTLHRDNLKGPYLPAPSSGEKNGAGKPVPGVDNKSSTRPGE